MKTVFNCKNELLFVLTIILYTTVKSQTVSDFDGNIYPIVTIGDQTWMAENLRARHYSDGTPLEYTLGSYDINDTLKRFFYYNDDSTIVEQYGCLYNWFASVRGTIGDSLNPSGLQGVCPVNWHLPSVAEWEELFDFLGENAADQLKPGGWTGFNAQFGGMGGDNQAFSGIDMDGNYINSNPDIYNFGNPGDMIQFAVIKADQPEVICYPVHTNTTGYSVRCVRNSTLITEIALIPGKSSITYFPNPCRNMITVESEIYTDLIIKIYSIDGKLVINSQLSSNKNTIMLNNLNKGLYIIKLQNENKNIVTDKLLVN